MALPGAGERRTSGKNAWSIRVPRRVRPVERDARILADRGARLVDRLKPFIGSLNNMGVISIEFFDMLLRGDSERPTPEAMTRPTRR